MESGGMVGGELGGQEGVDFGSFLRSDFGIDILRAQFRRRMMDGRIATYEVGSRGNLVLEAWGLWWCRNVDGGKTFAEIHRHPALQTCRACNGKSTSAVSCTLGAPA